MQLFGGGDELAKKKDIASPNLFTGSKDFTGDWIYLPKDVQKDKYLDFTAICVSWAWNGISQYIAVNKGETFTFSLYVKAKAGSTINVPTQLNVDPEGSYKMAITSPNFMQITGTGNWQKISMTFTVTSDSGAIKPRIESTTGDPYWIAGMKLERGTVATPWCPAPEDYAMKPDVTTKIIIQDVDINTLTEEGNFFVESGNLDHFPAEYRDMWYFLNVTNAIGHGDAGRIKQTVTPDHSGNGWTMTRTGVYHDDTRTVEWESWLISDFAKGKLLKSN